jgi:hypothetical protein
VDKEVIGMRFESCIPVLLNELYRVAEVGEVVITDYLMGYDGADEYGKKGELEYARSLRWKWEYVIGMI